MMIGAGPKNVYSSMSIFWIGSLSALKMPSFSSGTSSSVIEKNRRYETGISNASHILFIVSLLGNEVFFSILQRAFAEMPHFAARSF